MSGKTIAKSMTICVFINTEFLNRFLHRFFPLYDVVERLNLLVMGKVSLKENILPDKALIRIFIFFFKHVGQMCRTETFT